VPVTPTKALVPIEQLIVRIRGQRVILAPDLARIYGVQTKALNQAVKRNISRFPPDFLFQLTRDEAEWLRRSRSQFVTLKRGENIKYLPYAFTEHGAIMAATILNSPRAVQMTVFVVRAFVKMRSAMSDTTDLARKLARLEKELKQKPGIHEAAIVDVLRRIMNIIDPPPEPPPPPKRRIGFGVEEPRTRTVWSDAGRLNSEQPRTDPVVLPAESPPPADHTCCSRVNRSAGSWLQCGVSQRVWEESDEGV
jgi:phage regulator Rha-like protein